MHRRVTDILVMLSLLITNAIFISLSHPLSMGLMLLFQTLMMAILTGMMLPSFWYAYILILIFLGGVLILFIYVSSMASNEQMNTNSYILPLLISLVLISIVTLTSSFSLTQNDMMLEQDSFFWMFSWEFMSLSFFLIMYLFIVLIGVVKITKWWGGAVRKL